MYSRLKQSNLDTRLTVQHYTSRSSKQLVRTEHVGVQAVVLCATGHV
jgi:hypothetical protein